MHVIRTPGYTLEDCRSKAQKVINATLLIMDKNPRMNRDIYFERSYANLRLIVQGTTKNNLTFRIEYQPDSRSPYRYIYVEFTAVDKTLGRINVANEGYVSPVAAYAMIMDIVRGLRAELGIS